jgi:hypothetical protein
LNAKNSISDHAFGRGFDIFSVTSSSGETILFNNPVPAADVYLKGLNIILAQIEALPQELHPDLIVVSDLLAAQLGIRGGLEDANSGIRLAYPNMAKHTNFHSDKNHRNHVHISFGAKRSGSFQPVAPGRVTAQGTGSPATAPAIIPAGALEKLKISYKTKKGTALTRDEVMQLLTSSGLFEDEIAALFVGISQRESGWQPGALNTNRSTGDFSFGLFQINFLPAGGGTYQYPIIYPTAANVLGVKLAYSIDADTNVTTLSEKVKSLATRETSDERMFIPYNQVHMLASKCIGLAKYKNVVAKNQKIKNYYFGPWGDYKNLTDAPMGAFTGVKYSTVRDAYITNTGKSEATLKAFIKAKFKGKKPYAKLNDWFSGYYYTMAYKSNGNLVPSERKKDTKF